jgi:hypothetical protein
MKTLRERFSLVRSHHINGGTNNNNHTIDVNATAALTDIEGTGAHGHTHDDDYESDHDSDDDDAGKEGLSLVAAVAQNTGNHPNPTLRLRRILVRYFRRLGNPCAARPRTFKAVMIVMCTAVAVSDPPFYLYPVVLGIPISCLVQSICWPCHARHWTWTVLSLCPVYCALWFLFHFLANVEVKRQRSYSFDVSNVNKSRHFYYMSTVAGDYDPKLTARIAAISQFVNNSTNHQMTGTESRKRGSNRNNPETSSLDMDTIEPLPVHNVKLFDNAIRFDFLLEFVRNDAFTADFACLIESDVVVRTQYFRQEWSKRPAVEFAHVQHHWGHLDFEAQNVGVLCVSKTASDQTVRWLRRMSYLNNRRYCRLLIKPLLYSPVLGFGLPAAKQHVFAWDRDGGCTVLRPYCNYIHFTRPKGPALDEAMKIVQRGSFETVSYN